MTIKIEFSSKSNYLRQFNLIFFSFSSSCLVFFPFIPLNTGTVPPRWMVEPMDVSVERKGHITLHCQAQGVPIPTVVWKKATGI